MPLQVRVAYIYVESHLSSDGLEKHTRIALVLAFWQISDKVILIMCGAS
jgi:hypothetical protein